MFIKIMYALLSLILTQLFTTEGSTHMPHEVITATCAVSQPAPSKVSPFKTIVATPVLKLTNEERVCILIDRLCEEYEFNDPALIKAIVMCESSFNKNSVSAYNARGLMQITPRWFIDDMEKFGVSDLCADEVGNLTIGINYMKELINNNHGNVSKALVAYHDGGSVVENGTFSTAYSKRVLRVAGGYK